MKDYECSAAVPFFLLPSPFDLKQANQKSQFTGIIQERLANLRANPDDIRLFPQNRERIKRHQEPTFDFSKSSPPPLPPFAAIVPPAPKPPVPASPSEPPENAYCKEDRLYRSGIHKRQPNKRKAIVAWRKYGEKWIQREQHHPEGTRVQRLYFRCNSPGCSVKKQVEHKMIPGQTPQQTTTITGEHNHTTVELASGHHVVEGKVHDEDEESSHQECLRPVCSSSPLKAASHTLTSLSCVMEDDDGDRDDDDDEGSARMRNVAILLSQGLPLSPK